MTDKIFNSFILVTERSQSVNTSALPGTGAGSFAVLSVKIRIIL